MIWRRGGAGSSNCEAISMGEDDDCGGEGGSGAKKRLEEKRGGKEFVEKKIEGI